MDYWCHDKWQRKNEVFGEKSDLVPLCPLKIQNRLPPDRTRNTLVINWQVNRRVRLLVLVLRVNSLDWLKGSLTWLLSDYNFIWLRNLTFIQLITLPRHLWDGTTWALSHMFWLLVAGYSLRGAPGFDFMPVLVGFVFVRWTLGQVSFHLTLILLMWRI
jgi:hypothetical protein